jgi:hypothetical protein
MSDPFLQLKLISKKKESIIKLVSAMFHHTNTYL